MLLSGHTMGSRECLKQLRYIALNPFERWCLVQNTKEYGTLLTRQ